MRKDHKSPCDSRIMIEFTFNLGLDALTIAKET